MGFVVFVVVTLSHAITQIGVDKGEGHEHHDPCCLARQGRRRRCVANQTVNVVARVVGELHALVVVKIDSL